MVSTRSYHFQLPELSSQRDAEHVTTRTLDVDIEYKLCLASLGHMKLIRAPQ